MNKVNAEYLRGLRVKAGWSLTEFVFELRKKTGVNVSASAASKWERGTQPTPGHLYGVSLLYDKPMERFIKTK